MILSWKIISIDRTGIVFLLLYLTKHNSMGNNTPIKIPIHDNFTEYERLQQLLDILVTVLRLLVRICKLVFLVHYI